jgi:hypothetical protein
MRHFLTFAQPRRGRSENRTRTPRPTRRITAIDSGTLATSNGMIGGQLKGTYDEVGLFGQFR